MSQSNGSQPGEYGIHDFERRSGIECNYPVIVYGPEKVKGVPISLIEVRLPEWHPRFETEAEIFFVLVRPATKEEEQDEENDFLEWLNGLRLRRNGVECSMKFMRKVGEESEWLTWISAEWPTTLLEARARLEEMASHAEEYPALFG